MTRWGLFLALAGLLASPCAAAPGDQPESTGDPASAASDGPPFLLDFCRARLEALHVPADGLAEFVRPRFPSLEDRLAHQQKIELLSADEFARREQATRELIEIGELVSPQLKDLEKNASSETRLRVAFILSRIRQQSLEAGVSRRAALRLLAAGQQPIDPEPLLQLIEHADDAEIRAAAARALARSATPEHLEALREAVATAKRDDTRLAAMETIARLPGEPKLAPVLEGNASLRVRVAAARLANDAPWKRRLEVLSVALASQDVRTRADAVDALRAISGRRFGYAPYDSQLRRARAASLWQEWTRSFTPPEPAPEPPSKPDGEPTDEPPTEPDESSETEPDAGSRPGADEAPEANDDAEPTADDEPDAEPSAGASRSDQEQASIGPCWRRLMLCHIDPFAVREVDFLTGEEVFYSETVSAPTGAISLHDGWRLFSDWGEAEIVGLDALGQPFHRISLAGRPKSLRPTARGYLLALDEENRVIEVDHQGEEVWSAKLESAPSDAQRLENGNTLVALYSAKLLLELDEQGRETARVDTLEPTESARRLANGNFLVTTSLGRVREFTPQGEVAWITSAPVPMAQDAVETPSGTIVIAYRNGVREVTRDGLIVREFPFGQVQRVHGY